MKKFVSILLLITLCLVSCAEKTTNENYKTDVSVESLSSMIYEKTNDSSLTLADDGWVALNIPIELSLASESDIYISTTGKADLFGVFKANSETDAEKLLEQSEDYLEKLEANWMSEYLAEELPKIQNAVCKKCGLYVTFLILEDDARTAAATEFENMLKQ